MAKELPQNPNLEHLKKQAKDVLRDLRGENPGTDDRLSGSRIWGKPRLADAQNLLAREYGFAGWQELKKHVDSLRAGDDGVIQRAHKAFVDDDARTLRDLLDRYPNLKSLINDPSGSFDSPPITLVRSKDMLDVLLEAGADINGKSRWWAGGFGLLDNAGSELAEYAITRGATVTVHAAARLGKFDVLKKLVTADPGLVSARGPDGQMPLHCAATVEIAAYLIEHGADINARDVDHDSTAAQYMVRSRPDVARYLVGKGCETDILLAAALGDRELVDRHLQEDPACIKIRVNDEYFPRRSSKGGGTIYQWELGWHVSACQIAKKMGHETIYKHLMEVAPIEELLLNACWLGDKERVRSLLPAGAGAAGLLSPSALRHIAHAARNNDGPAVALMLEAGFPVGARGQHNATPLHWACFHGNAEMVDAVLRYGPLIEDMQNDFGSTPLGWAIHGSTNGWYSKTGNYAMVVRTLVEAGAKVPREIGGSKEVRDVLIGR